MINDNVIHLMRGQVFDIEGRSFFTMGGASSHDISDGILELDDPHLKETCRLLDMMSASYRIKNISWWEDEIPDEKEFNEGKENLKNTVTM